MEKERQCVIFQSSDGQRFKVDDDLIGMRVDERGSSTASIAIHVRSRDDLLAEAAPSYYPSSTS